jgi:DNA-binding NtrC family response regulator
VNAQSQKENNASTKNRILIVEDETDVLVLIKRMRNKNWLVDTAVNAEEAAELIKDNKYTAVISDYDMPGPDGIDLLETVEKLTPESLRILHTGCSPDLFAPHLTTGLVQRYIPKPAEENDFNVISIHENNLNTKHNNSTSPIKFEK